jgi:hypothetical protein
MPSFCCSTRATAKGLPLSSPAFWVCSTKEWGPFQIVTTANGGGRGLYFQDPNGHLLEIITRAYGKRMLRNRILIANLARFPTAAAKLAPPRQHVSADER